jgi:hypothetical protein
MTTRTLASLLLLTLILVPGCVRSLHPIYTTETLTYDPAFLGSWVDEKGETRLDIAASSDNDQPDAIKSYRVTHTDKDHESAQLLGHLAKVGDLLVADLTIADENDLPRSDFAKSHLFPLHTFWILHRGDDGQTFTVRALEHDWMKKFIDEKPAAVAHYKTSDDIILTAPPEELQKFLLAHAKDAGMLTDAELFRRVKPTDAPTTAPAPGSPTSR